MTIKDKTRDEIDDKYKWDLSQIYSSLEEWNKDFEYVKANGDKYLEFKGKLNNADNILNYFKFDEEFSKKADSLYMYAALKFDEDTSNSKYQELKGKIEKVLTDNNATITLNKEMGQKELAYEIKKCKSGYYYLYNIEANDDKAVKEFDRIARIDENVIRHLILNLEK